MGMRTIPEKNEAERSRIIHVQVVDKVNWEFLP